MPKNISNRGDVMNAFYEQQKTCPVCGTKFTVTRVRSSACVVTQRDSDFRVRYKDIDPLLYSIWVCPNCQYANTEKEFNKEMSSYELERLKKGLALLKSEEPDFSGERTVQTALRAMELALQTALIRKAPAIVIAGFYLRMAWLYRELGKKPEEMKALEKARDYYQHSFEKESGRYSDRMSDLRLMYLIGELNRRVGDYEEAIKWFSRAVMNKDINREPEIRRLARDQWELAREEYKKQAAGQTEQAENAGSEQPEQTDADQAPAAAEQSLTPEPRRVSRGSKVRMYVSLYMDQVEWITGLANKVYDRYKETLPKESVARAIIDAVMEKCTDLDGFKTEEDLKNAIAERIKCP